MRQFKLWNSSKTAFFNFQDEGVIITDVSGLGINFDVSLTNGKVVNFQKEFEDIGLLANFGVNSNAYTSFNSLAEFIALNGRKNLILEYEVNNRTLLADIIPKRIPKTQKTNFGIISENLTFTRLTYWYMIEESIIPEAGLSIFNNIMDDLEVNLSINGTTQNILEIVLLKETKEISKIKTLAPLLNGTLDINAETKRVSFLNTLGVANNAYNLIDKKHDTFLLIPTGQYIIKKNTENEVRVRYKKWVID